VLLWLCWGCNVEFVPKQVIFMLKAFPYWLQNITFNPLNKLFLPHLSSKTSLFRDFWYHFSKN
jgi:hypothetical protein